MDRIQAIKAMHRDYPEMPVAWCEMVYDFVTKNPELAEKINNGEEAIPPPKDRSNCKYGCTEYKSVEEMERIEKNVGRMELICEGI